MGRNQIYFMDPARHLVVAGRGRTGVEHIASLRASQVSLCIPSEGILF